MVPFKFQVVVPVWRTPWLVPTNPTPPIPVIKILFTLEPPLPAVNVAPAKVTPWLVVPRGLLYKPPPVPFKEMVPPSPVWNRPDE